MTNRIKASDYQADVDTRIANEEKFSGLKHVDVCFLCGRGLTEKARNNGWWVHLTEAGELAARDEGWDVEDSQGAFPVGSECAKKVPASHRLRIPPVYA